MSNIICQADIRKSKKIMSLLIWCIIAGITTIIGSIPKYYSEEYYCEQRFGHRYRILFVEVADFYKHRTAEDTIYKVDHWTEHHYIQSPEIIIMLIIVFIILIVPLYFLIKALILKKCNLELRDDGIFGNRKTLFHNKQLNLPTDKIDNVMVNENFIDKLLKVKTVSVCSSSGIVKFPWVKNADEFVNATLVKIEEYKTSVKSSLQSMSESNASSGSNGASLSDKLTELKNLADQGLITQEEFDKKRKELLSKM